MSKMEIILVNPYFYSHIITPPLGLGYLSSNLRRRCGGVNVSILDCLVDNVTNFGLLKLIAQKKADLIGLTTYSMFYENVRDITKAIKKMNRDIRVVIGGPHVSALPRFSLEDTSADFAVFGEGEETLAELVNKLCADNNDFSTIGGICYRDNNNKIIQNSHRALIKDISSIPWPDWQLINPNKYPKAPHGGFYKRFPIAPIITTRGCPFSCLFCGTKVTWTDTIRYRNKEDVVDEMEYITKKYGVREFHFEDDNFTLSRKHAVAICEEIIRRKLNIIWACPNGVRIDALDDELLRIMKRAGCYLLAFGIESGSQETLNKMNKKLDLGIIDNVLKRVRNIGIETWGFFIIGLPGENERTVMKTIRYARELPLDRAQFCIFTPIPGTPLFKLWLKQQDIQNLSDIKWSEFNFSGRCILNDTVLNKRALSSLQRKAFISFYCRPRIAFNIISKIKLSQLRFMIRRIREYILK
jgi:radical SAM superfamily enzyme YgiQ (UPF0313 family)